LRRYYSNSRSKGSITVEACAILPIFLSTFFLLLFLVKFTCTGMLLDYAVNETAKEIAAAIYPLSFINEIEDEKIEEFGDARIPTIEEELKKLGQQTNCGGSGSILNVIISEDLKGADVANALEGILKDYRKGIIGSIVDIIKPSYWDMKSAAKYMIADSLIRKHLGNPIINKDNIRLRVVEFPQGKEEYNARSSSDLYKSFRLVPGKDFDSDDVVLQVEYDYRIKLPFIKAFNVKMVHSAVERAWINGSFGVLTEKDEGLNLEPEANIVFITRTGIRYHKESCRYLRKSKIPIEIEGAKKGGYTPCKVCKPPN